MCVIMCLGEGRQGIMEITIDDLEFSRITIVDAHGNREERNLQDELMINPHNIEDELYEQPQKYVYYTALLEKVRSYLESAKLAEEMTHARMYEPARETLVNSTGRNPTKDQIESHILVQEEYSSKREQVIILEATVKNLQYVVRAFEQRKDMLVQLSTHERKREEYEQALKQAQMNQGYRGN